MLGEEFAKIGVESIILLVMTHLPGTYSMRIVSFDEVAQLFEAHLFVEIRSWEYLVEGQPLFCCQQRHVDLINSVLFATKLKMLIEVV